MMNYEILILPDKTKFGELRYNAGEWELYHSLSDGTLAYGDNFKHLSEATTWLAKRLKPQLYELTRLPDRLDVDDELIPA